VDSISNKLAVEIANDLVQNEGIDTQAALDLATIKAIADTLLSLGKNCAAVISDLDKLRNPGLINKIRLRQLVSRNIKTGLNSRIHLRSRFGQIIKSTVNSILKRGQTATISEVNGLIEEAKLANQNS
jgi:ribosomal protein S1